jgi:glycosyltransferase involved in cell wall biosynthesis
VVQPLLNDRYLGEFYAGKRISRGNLLRGYLATFRRLLGARHYDLIVIEKEIFPFLPAWAEWWLNRLRIPFIADYDDAIFHNYDLSPHPLVRLFLGRKIARVMHRAEAVVCGNEYLAAYARRAGVRRVIVLPTVIDTGKYLPRSVLPQGRVVIGWIGSPTSLKYLLALKPVLSSLVSRYPICIHIVGGAGGIGLGDAEKVLVWSEATEVEVISGFDIGIMPLEDSPWERGKCGYKLIQYMGCGLPVVGSPVGVNEAIILEGVNGFKPGNAKAWEDALERLIGDAGLRERLGHSGRKLVEERYSLDGATAQWLQELNDHNHVRDIRNHTLSH